MKMFGMEPNVVIFKEPSKELFSKLITTCESSGISVSIFDSNSNLEKEIERCNADLIVDSILGFSFKPPLQFPISKIVDGFKNSNIPVFSVDIPSGWNVDEGNIDGLFEPEYLISLTLPKLGMKLFKGQHFVGGRFIPK